MRTSEAAVEIKRLYNRLVRRSGKPKQTGQTEPLEQMLRSILMRGTTETRANAAMKQIARHTVDLNELRVTPPAEIVAMIGKRFPDAEAKAVDIRRVLNGIFDRQNTLDLSGLSAMNKPEVREWLESLPGIDPYTVASVMLLSFGLHAVPVDRSVLELLQREGILDADADPATLQNALERHIPVRDAYAFSVVMQRHAAARAPRTAKSRKTSRPRTSPAS